jgi:hypothetical protein
MRALRVASVWIASAGAEGGGERVLATGRLFERAGEALAFASSTVERSARGYSPWAASDETERTRQPRCVQDPVSAR